MALSEPLRHPHRDHGGGEGQGALVYLPEEVCIARRALFALCDPGAREELALRLASPLTPVAERRGLALLAALALSGALLVSLVSPRLAAPRTHHEPTVAARIHRSPRRPPAERASPGGRGTATI